MRFRILIILFVFIELLSVMLYARNPSFTSLENSINTKMNNFKTNCTGKLTSFETNVNGKLNAWDSNYQSKMKSFESGVNAKCNALSTSISNKVAALESSINNKFDSAGFSAFKSDANNAFKNLASELATMKNDLKTSLQAELGDSFSSISGDFDSFSSGLQTEAVDISNDFEENGELSDAVDECEDAVTPATVDNSKNSFSSSGWVKQPWPSDWIWHIEGISPGTYMVTGGPNSADGVYFQGYNSANEWVQFGNTMYVGGRVDIPAGSSGVTAKCNSGKYIRPPYGIQATSSMDGPPLSDTDGDGYTDDKETSMGTDPNNPASNPTDTPPVPEEPEPESAVDLKGASSGNSAIDAIIAKLTPDFTVFYGASPQDFTLTIPVHLGDLYSTEWHVGPFDDLLDGKISWLRTAIRGFVMAVMSFVFIRSLVKVLKEW